jgi:methylisocitrate lyase
LARDGVVSSVLERMLTRQELYDLIGYADYEALDASIVRTIVPR